MMRRNSLPRSLNRVAGFPNNAAALVQTFQRIGMRERFWIATKNNIDMVQFAIHPNSFRSDDQIVIGGRAFFLGAVLWVGHDPNFFDLLAVLVILGILFGNQAAKVANN